MLRSDSGGSIAGAMALSPVPAYTQQKYAKLWHKYANMHQINLQNFCSGEECGTTAAPPLTPPSGIPPPHLPTVAPQSSHLHCSTYSYPLPSITSPLHQILWIRHCVVRWSRQQWKSRTCWKVLIKPNTWLCLRLKLGIYMRRHSFILNNYNKNVW